MKVDSAARSMTIAGVHLRVFGGISNLDVSFEPGLNIVSGDNESGKSTLFRAIQHTLLTATNLDKRTLLKELDPFFPKPDGNFAECTIMVQGEGLLKVRRRWGADAEEEATLPDGTTVRGVDGVRGAVDRFLPVSAATFRTILLADQTQLDQTAELLRETPDARDEAAAALRSARLGAGGVSPDAFRRLLTERLGDLFNRWDPERNQPEGDRRYTDPWTRGAGRLVKAFYAVQKLEADLASVVRSEDELELARLELERTGEAFRAVATFTAEHAGVYAALTAVRGLSGEIQANEERIKTLRDDNRRWPLLQRDSTELETQSTQLTARRAALERELAAAREREQRAASKESLDRVDRLLAALTDSREARDAIAAVDESALAALREVESQLPYAEARLSSGHLRATVTSKEPRSIAVSADGAAVAEHETAPGAPVDLRASRHLLIEAEGLSIQVESGEESFEDLSAARDALAKERTRLRKAIGVDSVADAETRRHLYLTANSRATQLEQSICSEMDAADIEAALAARNELAREADGGEAAHETTGEPLGSTGGGRKQAVITDEISVVSQQLGAAAGQLENSRDQLQKLKAEHGSQEQLENRLGETNRVLSELLARRDEKGHPDGFNSADEFLGVYEQRQINREAAAETHNACRVSYAELIGSQPEQNSDEIRQEIAEARAEFDRLNRDAQSLDRVRNQTELVLGELDDTIFDPFVEKVATYAGVVTGGSYVPEPGDDPLGPERFARTGGPASKVGASGSRSKALPYELHSQGTRDSLALAVRLALADTVLGADSAPFILDDPLVDMDPARRAAAAGALNQFAERHQVIVLTCHPEHAALFPSAHQINISPV